jgi:HAD domain in Swiss Army Knife RNA repair proteins
VIDAVIFLDVDGVLNPQIHWDAMSGLPGPELRLQEAHLALAQELSTLGRIAWVSTWSVEQTFALGSAIGLPADTPTVSFSEPPADRSNIATPTWKLPFVERWLSRQERIEERSYQAVVWIDDDLHGDADKWANASSALTLLIRTDPDTGLTESGVARVRRFLTEAE